MTSVSERLRRRTQPDFFTGCWNWTGASNGVGYGQIQMQTKKNSYVHRVAYEHFVGPIPAGMDLDHLCRNRRCWNPKHLEPVSRSENCRRSPLIGRWERKAA